MGAVSDPIHSLYIRADIQRRRTAPNLLILMPEYWLASPRGGTTGLAEHGLGPEASKLGSYRPEAAAAFLRRSRSAWDRCRRQVSDKPGSCRSTPCGIAGPPDQSAGVFARIGYGNVANMGWQSWVRRSRWSPPRS